MKSYITPPSYMPRGRWEQITMAELQRIGLGAYNIITMANEVKNEFVAGFAEILNRAAGRDEA